MGPRTSSQEGSSVTWQLVLDVNLQQELEVMPNQCKKIVPVNVTFGRWDPIFTGDAEE